MIQAGQSFCFPRKSFGKGCVFAEFRRKNFQGDQSVVLEIMSLIDNAHPATPQFAENLVAWNTGDGHFHRWVQPKMGSGPSAQSIADPDCRLRVSLIPARNHRVGSQTLYSDRVVGRNGSSIHDVYVRAARERASSKYRFAGTASPTRVRTRDRTATTTAR